MFAEPAVDYFKDVARQDFERIHRRGVVNKVWSKLTGRRHRLLDIQTVRQKVRARTQSHAGLRQVPIRQILGSEGRSADFDLEWKPLKSASMERWTSIAAARAKGTNLPAVELIKVGDVYFVRDGHHRISVAKSQGQLEVEANVLAWQSGERSSAWTYPDSGASCSFRNNPAIDKGRQLLDAVKSQLSVVAGRSLPNPSV